jgi:hypothetical protein
MRRQYDVNVLRHCHRVQNASRAAAQAVELFIVLGVNLMS